jgi:hypothetical protein
MIPIADNASIGGFHLTFAQIAFALTESDDTAGA